jgi:hypothetical protein
MGDFVKIRNSLWEKVLVSVNSKLLAFAQLANALLLKAKVLA